MSHDATLSTVLFRNDYIFEGEPPPLVPKTMQAHPASVLVNYGVASMILNNDIVDDLDRYLANSEYLSDRSHTSSPTIPPGSNSVPAQSTSQLEFVLDALTASSARIHEETTTYLNQGQPYEIKFRVNNQSLSDRCSSSTTYRSILRLCFWEKSLQAQERELMQKWLNEYQRSSLFDIDMSLTYGVLSIVRSQQIPNAVEIVWDAAATTTSLFVRFKCTSTDFAQKRHGGEKGIPLRVQIDTYQEDELDGIKHLHACCCKIQLFRSKGAQRKNKADKMRIDKLNYDQRRRYQNTVDCTVLQSCPFSSLYSLNLLSLSYPPDDLSDVQTHSNSSAEDTTGERKIEDDTQKKSTSSRSFLSSSLPDIKSLFSDWQKTPVEPANTITIRSSADDVLHWLTANNFSCVLSRFQHYAGIDLLRLTVGDMRRICHDDDSISIRLFNQLHETPVPPLKTLFVKTSIDDTSSAIYLHSLTRRELADKLLELTQREPSQLILEANKIRIKIDADNVVKYSLPDQAQLLVKISPCEWTLCLLNTPA